MRSGRKESRFWRPAHTESFLQCGPFHRSTTGQKADQGQQKDVTPQSEGLAAEKGRDQTAANDDSERVLMTFAAGSSLKGFGLSTRKIDQRN
jgi:hypothetical protein